MSELVRSRSNRARRVAVAVAAITLQARCKTAPPQREWRTTPTTGLWRRTAAGTNRISCIGIWKQGSRREAVRRNRSGDTDWRRARRDRAFAIDVDANLSA